MPDWRRIVEDRLGRLGLDRDTESDVVDELAGHFEDRRAAVLRDGVPVPESEALALEEVPDWVALNREISAARLEVDSMSQHTRTIIVPGMTTVICASILGVLFLRLLPPSTWVSPLSRIIAPAVWLGIYCCLGALGAFMSRRAGGTVRARILSGIFPVGLHLAIYICVLVATLFGNAPAGTREALVSSSVRIIFGFIIVPGIPLALGTLPFLREEAPSAPQLAQTAR